MKRVLDNNSFCSSQRRLSSCSLKGENSVRNEMALGREDLGIQTAQGFGTLIFTQRLTMEHALQYLKIVRDTFQNKKETYDEFFKVMMDFKSQRIGTSDVVSKVKQLFKGHTELLAGFNMFLPEGEEITSPLLDKNQLLFEEAMNFVNKIKQERFQNDDTAYKVFLDILNKYRLRTKSIDDVYREVAALLQDHIDMVEEFSRFLPYCPTSDAADDVRDRNSDDSSTRQKEGSPQSPKDRDLTNSDNDGNLNGEDRCKRKRSEPRGRVTDERDFDNEKLPSKMRRVGEDFGDGGASNLASHHASTKHGENGSDATRSHSFCEMVKMKLLTYEVYQEFMRCIHLYTKGTLSRPELISLVNDLFHKDEFLMNSFCTFLDQCDRNECSLDVLLGKRFACNGEAFQNSSEDKGKDIEVQKMCAVPNKEKYQSKSIGDIDFTNSERCSPSYRLLPYDYPIPVASRRTTQDSLVLNDHWVSVTSGSEDYSFKHMRKNPFEEALFRCEDDRFELDMLLESVEDTTKRAEELMEHINKRKIESEDGIKVDDFLKALNLRCIERLYGDHGLDVIDVLKKNVSVALPVILTRLKQKQDEWKKCRSEFNLVWADIYAKNHQKSLDQRCSYFKLQDAKYLNPKALVAEIKQISEQKKNDDDGVTAFCTPANQLMSPHFEFDFPDEEIHTDIYQILKYYCQETGSCEQFDKVMKIWRCFLEPMLGFPSRDATSDSDSLEEEPSPSANDKEEGELSPTEIAKNGEVKDGQQMSNEIRVRNNVTNTKPVMKHDCDRCSKNVGIFYGSESFYLVFRFYQITYERILSAKSSSRSKDHYTRFLTALFKLIDGSSDNSKFEDDCRLAIGPNSYLVFTLDKLVQKLLKLMQTMATDEVETQVLQLNAYEKSRSSFADSLYLENASTVLLPDTLYRIESVRTPNSSTRVSVRVIDEKPEFSFPNVSTDENYADYVESEFVVPSEEKGTRGLFLKRNLMKRACADDGCVPEGVVVSNSLESRLSFTRSKVFYASNTEDFLFNFNRKHLKRSS